MTGPISKHFTWHEALYLPSWTREANGSDGLTVEVSANLEALFKAMDAIREHFGKPITVHVAYRPDAYNKQIGGAKHSSHIEGKACDFHVVGMDCDEVRQNILDNGLLDSLNLRMEDLPGSSWVHLDTRQPLNGHRFFKP